VERVDDIPVVYGMLERMGIEEHVDSGVNVHGNWIGLSPGWVITIWLVHILHKQNHLMEPVQKWVEEHKWTLGKLTGQKIRSLDFADDRPGKRQPLSASCFSILRTPATIDSSIPGSFLGV